MYERRYVRRTLWTAAAAENAAQARDAGADVGFAEPAEAEQQSRPETSLHRAGRDRQRVDAGGGERVAGLAVVPAVGQPRDQVHARVGRVDVDEAGAVALQEGDEQL